jgi:7-keto-8-aminopelargonate synthetase-like enzyme
VSFASNDYLGLSQHPAVKAAAGDALERWGAGSGSARLIVGDRPPHRDLEEELAGHPLLQRLRPVSASIESFDFDAATLALDGLEA